ncbi:MAG: FAD-dependent oxidoreductase [Blastocatellia bacterium]|nr:FAD-dependent oxidoreductase [Blastocatellia bacterium]MDW8168587.1 FAD-dependent oxidoreductase [Acidobacteriota bacterium]
MIRLTINNQTVEVPEGTNLLTAIEKCGLRVPTLCYHKALTPYGACRLCVVEIHAPGRPPTVQASCTYPALDGLSVFTDTERVRRARKITAELLLARCPDSDVIRHIAAEYGVYEPRIKKKYDDCIYCGLCVRMCQERMGRSAIGFTGRGPRKKLEPPFGKHNPICWTCGACDFICPVGKKVRSLASPNVPIPILNPYNMGLNERPAVSIYYPQAIPNKPAIDPNVCVRLKYNDCGICEAVCEAKAIRFDQKEETIQLNVGAIILSPGYEIFEPRANNDFGYGRYPNVITSLQFERILSPSGPYGGAVLRPSDLTPPKRIAFIQCVGSRDYERDYCSSVCCMYATKEAIIAKEHAGEDLQCDIFFMDIRAFSKGFEAYYETAKKLGVNYIRCRVPKIEEIPETKNLRITYLTDDDRKVSKEYDLVVLSVGMQPPQSVRRIAETFGVRLNRFGFCETSVFGPVETGREGIYVAGPFTEPKDIPETVSQASAAAAKVMALLGEVRGSLIAPTVYPPEMDVRGQEPRVGVFVCHCGTNIAGVVNVPAVVEYARTLPGVVYAENNLYTCSNDSLERIKQKITEHGLNRVVVASCTPRTHEALFRSAVRAAGLNPYYFEMANIREHCSWVHSHEPDKATEKAKDLVRMAVAKVKLNDPLYPRPLEVNHDALVIGGGLAGMTAALALADQGFTVHLVEKEAQLGGYLRGVYYLLNGEDPQAALKTLIATVIAHPNIRVYTSARLTEVKGSLGNFESKITVGGEGATQEIRHGVIIVATGAQTYMPTEFLYGQDDRVLLHHELEERIANNGFTAKSVAFIQCVGSRNKERPYCSRTCCSETIKHALKLKELDPDMQIYVLYREMRTYGFREAYYTKARKLGVAFIRYADDRPPTVVQRNGRLAVIVRDETLGETIELLVDHVILAAATIPREDNKELAQLLKVPLSEDRFFLEAHRKLRPLDFATDGIFLCGNAHSPLAIEEVISQALGAAARAATILSKDTIELEPTISHVVTENCDGCAYCVDPCPFKAITLVEYVVNGEVKKRVEVNEAICKGCGTCMATCPKRAIYVWHFRPEQLLAEVKAALGVMT